MVPVLLVPEDEGRDMAAVAASEPLATILRALRSFDPRVVEQLALPPADRSSSTPKDVLAADPAGDPRHQADTAMEEGEPADEDHAELALLRFSRRGREAEEIARLVRTRVLRLEPTSWLTSLEAVRTFAAEHGHGNIPYTATAPLGDHGIDYPVDQWAAEQRHS
ncbi:helicase associated domain-containing protein [Streptomyces smyrnaeus]|uniref:helicase associated domain-containing protein n=1 Tax=Streptomyces smyrnaeus TaxID=1387713 RepID=UPI0036C97CC5